jgi:hypothetical protein
LNDRTALAFVGVIYFLLVLVPVSFLAISILQKFKALKFVVMLCLLVFSVSSAVTWLKEGEKLSLE